MRFKIFLSPTVFLRFSFFLYKHPFLSVPSKVIPSHRILDERSLQEEIARGNADESRSIPLGESAGSDGKTMKSLKNGSKKMMR